MSSLTPPTTGSKSALDQVGRGAGRSVVSSAALHGAVLIRVGGVELALADILDLGHIVAASVAPAPALNCTFVATIWGKNNVTSSTNIFVLYNNHFNGKVCVWS